MRWIVMLVAFLLSLFTTPDVGVAHHRVTHYKGWTAPDSWCQQHVDSSHMRNCIKAQRVIHTVFPHRTYEAAMRVSLCETGRTFDRWATNRYSRTAGLFQIHPGNNGTTWYWSEGSSLTIDSTRLYNSWYNARVALYMSKGGTDWDQWDAVCRA
jgi:hypothetical protein